MESQDDFCQIKPSITAEEVELGVQQTSVAKNPIKKVGRGSEWTFVQRRHTNGQQVCKKMLHITNPQGNKIKATVKYHLSSVLSIPMCLKNQGCHLKVYTF